VAVISSNNYVENVENRSVKGTVAIDGAVHIRIGCQIKY